MAVGWMGWGGAGDQNVTSLEEEDGGGAGCCCDGGGAKEFNIFFLPSSRDFRIHEAAKLPKMVIGADQFGIRPKYPESWQAACVYTSNYPTSE